MLPSYVVAQVDPIDSGPFELSQCRGDQRLADHQRRNQKSSNGLARHYVIYGKCLTDWRVLLRVFFRSDLEHGFSFGRISDNG